MKSLFAKTSFIGLTSLLIFTLSAKSDDRSSFAWKTEYSLKYHSVDCEQSVREYELFVKKSLVYFKRLRTNPASVNMNEHIKWENAMRKFQDLVYPCASDSEYSTRVQKAMQQLLMGYNATFKKGR